METILASFSLDSLLIPALTALSSVFVAYQAFKGKVTTEIAKILQRTQIRDKEIDELKEDLDGIGKKMNTQCGEIIKLNTLIKEYKPDKDNIFSKINSLEKKVTELSVKLEYSDGKSRK